MSMKNAYTNLAGLGNVAHKLKVEPMYLPTKGLNISMMKTLMGIDNASNQPLYMEVSPSSVSTQNKISANSSI
jgi:hypothetical protein